MSLRLSTLEQTGILSQVESLAAQRYGAVPFGLGGSVTSEDTVVLGLH